MDFMLALDFHSFLYLLPTLGGVQEKSFDLSISRSFILFCSELNRTEISRLVSVSMSIFSLSSNQTEPSQLRRREGRDDDARNAVSSRSRKWLLLSSSSSFWLL